MKKKALIEKEELNFPKINENHSIRYYDALNLNFRLKESDINSHYTLLKNSEFYVKHPNEILYLEEAYRFIISKENRHSYLSYLLILFTLSQPQSLSSLELNFQNRIFPYYLFSVIYKEEPIILKLDFIKFKITLLTKNKLFECITIDALDKICDKNNNIVIKLNEDYDNKQFAFVPEIPDQKDYILTLLSVLQVNGISYLNGAKSNSNNNEKYQLIKNDSYLPSGAILKSIVMKGNKLGKSKRKLLLGVSQLIVLGVCDDMCLQLFYIIPLIPFQLLLEFEEKDLSIQFILYDRKLVFYFNSIEEFCLWRFTLLDIMDKSLEEKINKKNSYKMCFQNMHSLEDINSVSNTLNSEIDKNLKVFNNKVNEEVNNIANIKLDIFKNK